MYAKNAVRALIDVLLVGAALFPSAGAAQSAFRVHIDHLDNTRFPQVDVYIAVSDASGLPVEDLPATAFRLTEDGSLITVQDFEPIQNLEQPLAIALLVDTSESMGSKEKPTPLEKAIEGARSFVDQLTPEDQIAIIKFSDGPATVLPLTTDKEEVKLALDSLEPEQNRTDISGAIVEGVNALKSYSGRRIIVLVTDGKDTHSGLFTFDQAMEQAQNAAIPIYPLGFGNIINVQQLQQMAELTGGSAYIKASVFDLQTAFDEVLHNLRAQYKVRYISSFPADDTGHELLVSVNYQGGQEQDSDEFIAKSSSIPVSLPELKEGQVVGGLVRFAPAIDWPALKSLDILLDGSPLASISEPPFEYRWNSTAEKVSSGSHEFTFKATDVAGNTGQAIVHLDVQPPITLKVSNLTGGTYFGGPIVISAELAPSAGITVQSVEFLVDGTVINTVTAPPYETEWNVLKTAGPHKLSVKVYDSSGAFLAKELATNVPVALPGWVIVAVMLAIIAAVIPLALLSRRRRGQARPPLIPAGPAILREIEGLNPGQAWSLGSAELRLGRKRDENEIPLKGLNASRRHATICLEQGQYVIIPLSPNNPVLINNVPAAQRTILRPGDVIRLGETILRYENRAGDSA